MIPLFTFRTPKMVVEFYRILKMMMKNPNLYFWYKISL